LSSKDFVPVLQGFLAADAALSAATVTRLTVQWQDDARRFAASRRRSCVYSSFWACGSMAPNSSLPWPWATARRARPQRRHVQERHACRMTQPHRSRSGRGSIVKIFIYGCDNCCPTVG
jgi:hypothetical protein